MKKTLTLALIPVVLGLILIFAFTGHGFLGYALCFAGLVIFLLRSCNKTAKRVICAVLAVGIIYFAAVEVPIVAASRRLPETEPEYIIVLGASVHGSTPSLSLIERMEAARGYLEEHPDCIAIVSGGQGDDENLSEAQAMFNYLTEKGIAAQRVIMEDEATSTYENLSNSFDIIRKLGGEPSDSAVVSSEYHLYRAELIARGLGAEISGIPAHTTYPTVRLNYFIREAFGVTYQFVFG